MPRTDRMLSVREVSSLTQLSKPTIYRLLQRADFPAQVRLTSRKVLWLESEVRAWLRHRIASRARQ